jgi:crossover junction endodeoxyribonuclease RuvC
MPCFPRTFGRSLGIVLGVLAALSIRVTLIAPAAWKRTIGIPPGKDGAKDAARPEALRRWPNKAVRFVRVKTDNRAESALLALGGRKREARGV